ncbi:MAG TPA: thioredoxin family protein [Candidatus Limnocylindria bacterium]|jgi:disulfide oxidoreductase YuzD|nr:thioredoxin family protein [Candidatus Limnocylindria bacterium]
MTALETMAGAPAQPATLAIGAAGPRFEGLRGTDDRRFGFTTFADREALVLIFASNRCPTVKAYAERMNALQRKYVPRGVQLIAINANDPHLYPDEGYGQMIERAAEDRYTFPYVVDEGQRVAKAYGATCTFHLFVLDRERRLRYQGRFDDARLPGNVTSHDLRNALDELLSGKPVRVATTRPFGCSLDFVS